MATTFRLSSIRKEHRHHLILIIVKNETELTYCIIPPSTGATQEDFIFWKGKYEVQDWQSAMVKAKKEVNKRVARIQKEKAVKQEVPYLETI